MVDTHCHLSKEYYDNLDEIIANMGGLIITSGVNQSTNEEVIEIVSKYKNVYGCLGIHPEEVNNFKLDDLKFIEDNINNKKIVAIGEIGLDYHYSKDNKDIQKEIFIKQIELANKYNLPIVVHSRDAAFDTFNIIKKHSKTKADIHCYSSSLEMALEYTKLNARLGIGGVLTFNNADKLKNVVKNIDLKYLLLETDSPYLAPVPLRGSKNIPSNVYYVAKEIANLKSISVDEVINKTTLNAKEFFNIEGE